jgi:peptide/nickel transport system permease protein
VAGVDVLTYIARRLLLAIPLVAVVVTLLFVLIELSPGNAADKYFTPETPPHVRELIEKKWGLDQPAHVRYVRMMRNLMVGDFGRSMNQERPVVSIIARSLPNTVKLGVVTLLVVFTIGVAVGIVQAVRKHSLTDSSLSGLTLFLYSMPEFWLGLMLMLIFSLKLGWLPPSGMIDPVMHDRMPPLAKLKDHVVHLILPGIALGVAYAGGIARYMRSSMLEVVGQDYIRTARAKGLRERTVIVRHALRNALIPIVTLMGLSLPQLFSGAVVVESIFAWPGMGRQILTAIFTQDMPMLTACFFFFALLVVAGNLIADVLYAVVDPRIRFS